MIKFLFNNVRPITEKLPFGRQINYAVINLLLEPKNSIKAWELFRDQIMGRLSHCDFGMYSMTRKKLYITTHAGINGITAMSELLREENIGRYWTTHPVKGLKEAVGVFEGHAWEYPMRMDVYFVDYEEYLSKRKAFYKSLARHFGRMTTIASVKDDETLLFSTSEGGKPRKGWLNVEMSKLIDLAEKAGAGRTIEEKMSSIVKDLVPYLDIVSSKVGVLLSDLSVADTLIAKKAGKPAFGRWIFFPSAPPFTKYPSIGVYHVPWFGMERAVLAVRYTKGRERMERALSVFSSVKPLAKFA